MVIMENKTIRRNLYRILRKTGVRKENISLEASFEDDLHFDNTDWTIFTYYFEDIFKVNLEEENLKKLHCVNDSIGLLRQLA
jgi:acyl carrier protein